MNLTLICVSSFYNQEIWLVRGTGHVTEVPDKILKAGRASFNKARSQHQVFVKACNLIFITASVDCNKLWINIQISIDKIEFELTRRVTVLWKQVRTPFLQSDSWAFIQWFCWPSVRTIFGFPSRITALAIPDAMAICRWGRCKW